MIGWDVIYAICFRIDLNINIEFESDELRGQSSFDQKSLKLASHQVWTRFAVWNMAWKAALPLDIVERTQGIPFFQYVQINILVYIDIFANEE